MVIYEDLSRGQKQMVKRFFAASVLLATLLLLVLVLYYGVLAVSEFNNYRQKRSFNISASGEGSAFIVPNIAQLTLTVKTIDSSLDKAVSANNKKNNEVVNFLKSQGVAEGDIRTRAYNVYPQYQYGNELCLKNVCPPQRPPKIAGYEVDNSLEVKVRNLDKIGAILSGAVSAGANEVNGPSFTVDDETAVRAEARAKAIENAKLNAEKIAGNLGIGLGKLEGFSESGGSPPYYEAQTYGRGGGMGAAEVAVPSIEPGQNEVKVTVTLTYEIR